MGVSILFSTNDTGTARCPRAKKKKKNEPYLTPFTTNNLKGITDLNVEAKTKTVGRKQGDESS